MSFDELLRALIAHCPNGELLEDNEGQLVFYTGLRLSKDEVVPFESD